MVVISDPTRRSTMTLPHRRTIPALVAVAAIGLGVAAPTALASHGADDPVAHRAGSDDGPRHERGHDRGHHHHRGHHHRHGAHHS
jgi:hypothetical protein